MALISLRARAVSKLTPVGFRQLRARLWPAIGLRAPIPSTSTLGSVASISFLAAPINERAQTSRSADVLRVALMGPNAGDSGPRAQKWQR